jgi:hypothetical protein
MKDPLNLCALSISKTDAKSTPGILPINGPIRTRYAAGAALQTTLPGKHNRFFVFFIGDIILHRTDVKARLVRAGFATGRIDDNVRVYIDIKSCL